MSLNIRPLSEDLKYIAATELNELESRLAEEVEKLREWIHSQPHLRARTTDQFLVNFLRGSKHSLEKAKSKIDHFYTIRTMLPEVFKNLANNGKIRDLAASGVIIVPRRPPHLLVPEVCITRGAKLDNDRFKFIDITRARYYGLEYALQNVDNCIINGFVEIFDLSKVDLSLYVHIDFILMKKLSVLFEKGVPVRMKGFHVINCPKEGREILQLVKSMLIEKYKKLFFVHKSLEDLHKYIPREILPAEYGGLNGTIAEIAEINARDVESFVDYFQEDEQYGVDESLRLQKTIDERSLFGLEGSFRKLEID